MTREEHKAILIRLLSNPNSILNWLDNNDIDENLSEEAWELVERISEDASSISRNPHNMIAFYNLQFNTNFTLEELQTLLILA